MPKTILKFFVQLICILGLLGCGSQLEVGYKPPISIPVRVSINTQGEIMVGFSGDFVTPIGTFDVSGGTSINSIRSDFSNKVLVVRIDNEVVVYKLEEGKEFKVNFDDSNTLYKKVGLLYDGNGDIVLELESADRTSSSPNIQPEPDTKSSLSDPEEFIRGYFYAVVNQRDYDYLWTLATDNFQKVNSKGGYQDYTNFWNSVDSLNLTSVDFYERSNSSAKCQVKMTLYINGESYPLDVKYHIIYNSSKDSWMFESP